MVIMIPLQHKNEYTRISDIPNYQDYLTMWEFFKHQANFKRKNRGIKYGMWNIASGNIPIDNKTASGRTRTRKIGVIS